MVRAIRVERLVPSMNYHYLMITESMMNLVRWMGHLLLPFFGKGAQGPCLLTDLFSNTEKKKE